MHGEHVPGYGDAYDEEPTEKSPYALNPKEIADWQATNLAVTKRILEQSHPMTAQDLALVTAELGHASTEELKLLLRVLTNMQVQIDMRHQTHHSLLQVAALVKSGIEIRRMLNNLQISNLRLCQQSANVDCITLATLCEMISRDE